MKTKLIIALGVLVAALLWLIISIYPDWLWFENLSFSHVFWTMLFSKLGFGAIVWLALIIILFFNIYAARRLNRENVREAGLSEANGYFAQLGISTNTINIILLGFILIVSFIIASKGSSEWDMVLRYLYQQPFSDTDPIFHKNIGFFIFSLPFYAFIQYGFLVLFLFAGGIVIVWYLRDGAIQVIDSYTQKDGKAVSLPKITISKNAKKHIIFLGGIIALLLSWGYYLKIYNLMYSTQGPAFGASFTDVHIKIACYKIAIFLSIALSLMLFLNVFRTGSKKTLWASIGIWLGLIFILNSIIPMAVQKVVVKPNELTKESSYIGYNIDSTRRAYNLSKIKDLDFAVNDTLTFNDIEKESATIQNIRIWDERPLLQTYRQIQSIRLYYDFNNVDVDRYTIDDRYRQVMLSAREMIVDQLPQQAKTWVNRHLIYTHGYGAALSLVNKVNTEGLPDLLVKDLPPSFIPDLKIERPEIYYGERTDDYVLVKTKANEFDYPKGEKNVYATYTGNGGIPITSFLRRIFFAIEFLDPQILFTNYLNDDSRIMYNRRVSSRVSSIAPFIDYDNDPYLVISQGKFYWIIDGYTTSNMYPYSIRSTPRFKNKRLNYIRNSVKVTVDAYTGDVRFYMIDKDDPIVKTYAAIFPDLFTPFEQMPSHLKNHIRYPRELFKIQVDAYTKYHMKNIQTFYNQEDLWRIPDELYAESRQEIKPYYVIIKLPGQEKEEFLLMLPFTPSGKDNMIGWIAARSDLPNYGNILTYKLPKEKLIYGPMQIEARIDQQTEISREFSLWSQRGSRVIRGNLLAIPVSGTFIYVEPVYLEAKQEESEPLPQTQTSKRGILGKQQQSQDSGMLRRPGKAKKTSLPELKRVIVGFGNRLLMEKNLDDALRGVLGEGIITEKIFSEPTLEVPYGSSLVESALKYYNDAKEKLRQGNWAGYGEALEKLENTLKKLSKKSD